MNRKRTRFEFESIGLNENDPQPLFRQLEDYLRSAIQTGMLPAGEKLPSTRQLASTLQVSRNTVISAYDQLISEGYLDAAHGSGTRVSADIPELAAPVLADAALPESTRQLEMELSSYGQTMAQFEDFVPDVGWPRPFRPHLPALDLFPLEAWRKLALSQVRLVDENQLSGVDPQGYKPLRQAIAEYMWASRGVRCDEDQILVTSGAQQGMALLAQILLDQGDTAGLEDPGYMPARQIFDLAGLKTVSLAHDEDGIRVDELARLPKKQRPRLIYTTPGGQWPLGMTMSLPRRLELLQYAKTNRVWLIEDDYNGEFRYVGRRLPAMTSLDQSGCVVYMGSFSKLTFPAIRLGFLVLPRQLARTFSYARWLSDRFSPAIWQMVLCRFIQTGQFVKHLQKMRIAYAERQQTLCDALRQRFGDQMHFTQQPSGMHLTVFGKTKRIETALANSAKAANIDFHPVSIYTHDPKRGAGLVLGFAAYDNAKIIEAVDCWYQAYCGVSV
ncbi:PLP-dependent aminotransferase family protein [Rhodopirellula sp. MGV]|uniref:MocR-like pyridoxine biosynthesis transcription factor PdxR n=1 Tax=Rhodopirellula sp. MGV TaxID=2023130 RepID=UPI000B9747BA|nr:PLP-dependent aminotransferase family protein [Rhodopirellula sp. MGV]OYP36551.1 hypothetical protein CGZ80_07920 [Rhodopirellula sp. MGV]PNY34528.1 PLP-dependent aminotransferase family protein [Rhodopirellula baltica]